MEKVSLRGRLQAQVIPYRSFKEKIRLVRDYERKFKITIYEDYLIMEARK